MLLNPLPHYDLHPKSINIDQWNNPDYDWHVGLFGAAATPIGVVTGVMANNIPIDVVHWTASGSQALSPLTHWRSCMKILRHI